MIYHSPQASLYGAYKGVEVLGSSLFSVAKRYPCSTVALAIAALAIYHLSQRERLKQEVQDSLQVLKFAVRQMIC